MVYGGWFTGCFVLELVGFGDGIFFCLVWIFLCLFFCLIDQRVWVFFFLFLWKYSCAVDLELFFYSFQSNKWDFTQPAHIFCSACGLQFLGLDQMAKATLRFKGDNCFLFLFFPMCEPIKLDNVKIVGMRTSCVFGLIAVPSCCATQAPLILSLTPGLGSHPSCHKFPVSSQQVLSYCCSLTFLQLISHRIVSFEACALFLSESVASKRRKYSLKNKQQFYSQ